MTEASAEDLPEPIRRLVIALAKGMARADHEAEARRRTGCEGGGGIQNTTPGCDQQAPACERRSPG